jgi:nitrite reductase/ring-hydroxylating ferredoxin subunit
MSEETGAGHVCALTGSVCDSTAGDAALGGRTFDRRTMLTHAMLAAAAAALAACGVADLPTSPGTPSRFTLKVSDYASLSTIGGLALISAGGSPVAVVRTSADTFVALSLICPHQGSTIGVAFGGFMCPRHGAQFDISGRWIGGQRTSSMQSYAAAYDVTAGTLTVG